MNKTILRDPSEPVLPVGLRSLQSITRALAGQCVQSRARGVVILFIIVADIFVEARYLSLLFKCFSVRCVPFQQCSHLQGLQRWQLASEGRALCMTPVSDVRNFFYNAILEAKCVEPEVFNRHLDFGYGLKRGILLSGKSGDDALHGVFAKLLSVWVPISAKVVAYMVLGRVDDVSQPLGVRLQHSLNIRYGSLTCGLDLIWKTQKSARLSMIGARTLTCQEENHVLLGIVSFQ